MPTAQAATTSATEQERIETIVIELLQLLNKEDRIQINWRTRGIDGDIRSIVRSPGGGIRITVNF